MKKILLFLCVIFVSMTDAKSQTITGAPRACGGETFGYGLSSWSSGTIYKWKITKGKRSSDNATEFCGLSANITWDNSLGNDGKIQVYTVSDCSSSTGTLLATLDVKKFDFPQGSPMPTTNGTCASSPAYPSLNCGVSQDIDVWFMLPLYNNTDYNQTNAYDFTPNLDHVSLPAGWTIVSGALISSTYVCTEIANLPYKRIRVTVRTDGVHDGDVKVRVSRNCGGGGILYGAWSMGKTFSFAIPNISISGPHEFCSTETYSIPNLPVGATVSWSATGSIGISGASNVNPVTVTKITDGLGTLTAIVSTACSSVTITKNITAGYQRSITGPYSLCLNTWGNVYSVYEILGATNYQWRLERINGTSPTHTMMGNGGNMITLSVGNTGMFILYLTITTPCGPFETNFFITVSDPCDEWGMFTVYPNPSSTELKIVYKTDESNKATNERLLVRNDFNVKLINKKGKVLREGKTSTNNKGIVLQVADLPNGIYYLHIYDGKKISKQQLVISH